jgi:hypothetical protein
MDRTLGYTFASFSQQAKFQTYFQGMFIKQHVGSIADSSFESVAITVAVLYDHRQFFKTSASNEC